MEIGAVIAVSTAFVFGTPLWITLAALRHREKMKELEFRRTGSPALQEELAALRQEMAQLRETTTRFDMSYDAALDRLERRLAQMEGHTMGAAETYPSYRPAEEAPNVTVSLRRP